MKAATFHNSWIDQLWHINLARLVVSPARHTRVIQCASMISTGTYHVVRTEWITAQSNFITVTQSIVVCIYINVRRTKLKFLNAR